MNLHSEISDQHLLYTKNKQGNTQQLDDYRKLAIS